MLLNKRIYESSFFNIKGIALLNSAKYICYVIPFLFACYLYITAMQTNQPFLEKVEQNPIFTTLFLIAMLQPFVSLAIELGLNSLEKGSYSNSIHYIFILLALAELLLGNILACLLIGLGSCLHQKQSETKKHSNVRFYLAIGSSLFILLLSILCVSILIKLVAI